MKGSDRMILLALPLLALAIGFWLLVLSPKQKEAAELQDRIDTRAVAPRRGRGAGRRRRAGARRRSPTTTPTWSSSGPRSRRTTISRR